MIFKNTINFNLQIIGKEEIVEIDGISFSNIAYVLVFIDKVSLFDKEFFKESFLCFEELKKSKKESGNYLLFTSVSGIADDAGWDYIKVEHYNGCVKWNIERDDEYISYTFDQNQYIEEVLGLEVEVDKLEKSIELEPKHVIYPESMV